MNGWFFIVGAIVGGWSFLLLYALLIAWHNATEKARRDGLIGAGSDGE